MAAATPYSARVIPSMGCGRAAGRLEDLSESATSGSAVLAGNVRSSAGGFGRRLNGDYSVPAALAAKALSRFEAKFHQIETLSQIDRDRARRVWAQFQSLHPELGPGTWPDRFRELAAQLQ